MVSLDRQPAPGQSWVDFLRAKNGIHPIYGGQTSQNGQGAPPPNALGPLSQSLPGSGQMQPFYNSAPPQVDPTLFTGAQIASNERANAAQIAPNERANAAQSNATTGISSGLMNSLGADSTIAQIMRAFQPQAQQAQMSQNDALAAAGLSGGPAINQNQILQGQLSSSLGNTLAGAIQNSQANQLGAGEFGANQSLQQSLQNAGFQQNTNQFNASNQNATNAQQAGLQQNTNEFNASNQNAMNAQQAGLQQQSGLANQNASNQANEFNTQNQMSTQLGNTSTANQFQQFLASLQNGNWSQLLGGFQGLNAAGLSGQQGINQQAGQNFGIQGGAGQAFGGLTQALGNQYGQNQAPAQARSNAPIAAPISGMGTVQP